VNKNIIIIFADTVAETIEHVVVSIGTFDDIYHIFGDVAIFKCVYFYKNILRSIIYMINIYHCSKIYKITNNINDSIYIGATTQKLKRRFSNHISNCRNPVLKQLINDYGRECLKIELIKEVSCENKKQLDLVEKSFINELGDMNRCIPSRSRKEHYQDNKEYILERQHKYYNNNKESIREKVKEYRLKNDEYIKSYKNEKIECDICGSTSSRNHIKRHQSTKSCKSFIVNGNIAQ
jgi:hypothetical protein